MAEDNVPNTTTTITDDIAASVAADFNPSEVASNNTKERTFESFDQYKSYDLNTLRPAKEMWEHTSTQEKAMYNQVAEQSEDYDNAFDLFMSQYEEADKEAYENEAMKSDLILMSAEASDFFADQSDIKTWDFDMTTRRDYQTLGGMRQFGHFWTDQTRTIREAQIFGRAFINDKGEVVELDNNEEYLEDSTDLKSDVIYNDKYKSDDERYIVGFEYNYDQMDPRSRIRPLLRAVYQGETPIGEIVSRYDLADSWLKSNYLKRNDFKDIAFSLTRSTIGLFTSIGGGASELFKSMALLTDKDNKSDFIDMMSDAKTIARSFEVSKTDEDLKTMFTTSNMMDLGFDIMYQLLAIGGVAKAAKLITTAAKMPGAAAGVVGRLSTWLTYGTIGANDATIEAKKFGFGEDASAAFFLSMMAMLGVVGTSTSMMGFNWESRVGKQVVKDISRNHLKNFSVKEAGRNKATIGLAKRIVNDIQKKAKGMVSEKYVRPITRLKSRWPTADFFAGKIWNPKEGRIFKSLKKQSYMWAGQEEAFEEITEVGLERGLHHIWNNMFEHTKIDHPYGKDGFYTIYDSEFWEQLPMELVMSFAGGYAGGIMGRAVPFMGGKFEDIFPYSDNGIVNLAHIAVASNQPGMNKGAGLQAEKMLLKTLEGLRKGGALGSHELTINKDPVTGRLKKVSEDKDGITVGDAGYNMILMEYNKFKRMSEGWNEDYDTFLQANPDVRVTIDNEDYYSKKFIENFKELNGIFKLGDETIEARMAAPVTEDGFWKSPWKDWSEKKKHKKALKNAKKEKEAEESQKAKLEVEKAKKPQEAGEQAKEGEQAEAKVETKPEAEVTPVTPEETPPSPEQAEEDVKTKSTGEQRTATIEQTIEETAELEKEALQLVTDSQGKISIEDARRAVRIIRENDHIVQGVTAERDFIISTIKQTPEFSILYKDPDENLQQFAERLTDEIMRGDHRRYLQDKEDFALHQESLIKAQKVVDENPTVDKLLSLEKLKNSAGRIKLDGDHVIAARNSFSKAIDDSITPEEMRLEKKGIIEKHGLYNTGDISPEEELVGGYVIGDLINVDDIIKNSKSTGLLKLIEDKQLVPSYIQLQSIEGVSKENNSVQATVMIVAPESNTVKILDLNPKAGTIERRFARRAPVAEVFGNLMSSYAQEVETVGTGQADSEQIKLQLSWVDRHADQIIKVAISSRMANIKTATSLLSAEFDPTGISIIRYIKNRLSVAGVFGDTLYNEIPNSASVELTKDYLPSGVSMNYLLPDSSTMFTKWNPILNQWNTIDSAFDESIALDPDKDLLRILTRDFDASNSREITAKTQRLFTTEYLNPDGTPLVKRPSPGNEGVLEDLQRSWTREGFEVGEKVSFEMIMHDKERNFETIEKLNGGQLDEGSMVVVKKGVLNDYGDGHTTSVSIVDNSGKKQIVTLELEFKSSMFSDIDSARDLKKKLQVRLAITQLLTGAFPRINALGQVDDTNWLNKITNLRVYNYKIYDKLDWDAPVDLAEYDVYSKFYAHHIYDPIKANLIQSLDLRGIAISEEDQLQYEAIAAQDRKLNEIILPSLEAAILETDALIKSGTRTEDEDSLFSRYQQAVVKYGKSFQNDLGYLYRNKSEKFSAETLDIFNKAVTELDIAINKTEDDKGKLTLMNLLQKIGKSLYNLPVKEKEALINSEGFSNLTRRNVDTIFPYFFSKFDDYFTLSSNITGIQHKPTMVQDKVNFSIFNALSQVSAVGEPDWTKGAHKLLKNTIFLNAEQASGKSTLVAPYSIFAYQRKLYKVLPDELPGYKPGDDKAQVLTAAHSRSRAAALNTIMKNAKISTFTTESASTALDTKDLYDLLTTGTIPEIAKRLDQVAVIAFDEITHIWFDLDKKNSDLVVMLTQLEKVNQWRERNEKKRRPIKFVGIGDSRQGGWREGFPTVATWGKKVDYSLAGDEANIGTADFTVFTTERMRKHNWRANIGEIGNVSSKLATVKNYLNMLPGFGSTKIKKIVSYFGPIVKHAHGRWGGAEFLKNASDFYTSDKAEEMVVHIEEQLKKDPEFTVVIIDEDANKDHTNLPEGSPLRRLFEGENKSRVFLETIYSVQGGEYDYVLAMTPINFIPRLSDIGARNAKNYDLLSMIVGRAKYYARVVIPDNVNISSAYKEMFEIPAEDKANYKKKWEEFRADMYKDLEGEPVPDPKDVSPRKTQDISVETPDDEEYEEVPDVTLKNGAALDDSNKRGEEVIRRFGKEPEGDIASEIEKYEEIRDNEEFDIMERDEAARIVAALYEEHIDDDAIGEDDEINTAIETITGTGKPSKKTGNIAQEVGKQTARDTAKALERAGYTISYTHIKKEKGGPMSVPKSIENKTNYAITLLGKSSVIPKESLLKHIERASGLSKEGKSAMNDYKYELYTYDYAYSPEEFQKGVPATTVEQTTAIVATYKGIEDKNSEGKKFIVAQLVGKTQNMQQKPPSELFKLISARNDDLTKARTYFENDIDNNNREPGQFIGFEEFNKDYAHISAGVQPGTYMLTGDNLHKVPLKSLYGVGKSAKSHGLAYIKSDITKAVQKQQVFITTTVGGLVTASEDTKLRLGTLKGDVARYEGWEIFAPKDIPQLPAFVGLLSNIISYKEVNASNIDKFTNAQLTGDKKFTSFKDKDGENYYLYTLRGIYGEPIPMAYNVATGVHDVFFGITKDRRLMQDAAASKKDSYYNPAILELTKALDKGLSISPSVIKGNTKSAKDLEDYRKQIATTLHYERELKEVDDEPAMFKKLRIAADYTLKEHRTNFNLEKHSLASLRSLITDTYKDAHAVNHVSISEPLVFTRGEDDVRGKVFVIYNTSNNYNLKDPADINRAMVQVNLMRNSLNPKDPTQFFLDRAGLGIIMLDSPMMGFKETYNAFTKNGELTKGDKELDQSMMAMHSKTMPRMVSYFGELAQMFALGLNEKHEPLAISLFDYKPDGEHSRLIELWDDIENSKHGLGPVLDPAKKEDLFLRIKQALNSKDKTEAAGARLLVTTISHMFDNYNLGGLQVTDRGRYPTGTHIKGVRRATLRRHKKSGRFKTSRSTTAPIKYIPPSVEVAPEGKSKVYNDTIIQFSISNLLRLLMGHDQSMPTNLWEGVALDSLMEFMDELMYEYTSTGTINHGMFVSPAAVLKDKSSLIGWSRLQNSKDLEEKLFTRVKAIETRAFILNVGNIAAAASESKADIQPTRIIEYELEDKVTSLMSRFAEEIMQFDKAGRKDPEADLATIASNYNKEIDNLIEEYANRGLNEGALEKQFESTKNHIARQTNTKKVKTKTGVKSLTDMTVMGGYELFGIDDIEGLDDDTKIKLENEFFKLQKSVELQQYQRHLTEVGAILNGIKTDIGANLRVRIIPTINSLMSNLTATALDDPTRIDEIISMYDALGNKANFAPDIIKKAGDTRESVSLYSWNPGTPGARDNIVTAYLVADEKGRDLLTNALYAIPGTKKYNTNPYVIARLILNKHAGIDTDTDPELIELKRIDQKEYDRLMSKKEMKMAVARTDAKKTNNKDTPDRVIFKGPTSYKEFVKRINTIIDSSLSPEAKLNQLRTLKAYANPLYKNLVKLTTDQFKEVKQILVSLEREIEDSLKLTDTPEATALMGIVGPWLEGLLPTRLTTTEIEMLGQEAMARLKMLYPKINRSLDQEVMNIVNWKIQELFFDLEAYLTTNVPDGLSEPQILNWIESVLDNHLYEYDSISYKNNQLSILFKPGIMVEVPVTILSGENAEIRFEDKGSLAYALKDVTNGIRLNREALISREFEKRLKLFFNDFIAAVTAINANITGDIQIFIKDTPAFKDLNSDEQDTIEIIAARLDSELKTSDLDSYNELINYLRTDITAEQYDDYAAYQVELMNILKDMDFTQEDIILFMQHLDNLEEC